MSIFPQPRRDGQPPKARVQSNLLRPGRPTVLAGKGAGLSVMAGRLHPHFDTYQLDESPALENPTKGEQ